MARVITPPAISHACVPPQATDAQSTAARASRAIESRAPGITDVWRDALATFGAHPIAMLSCAVFGFAAPAIAGQWIATQAVVSNHGWMGPVITLSEKPSLAMLIVQAVVMLLVSSFARGMITALSLRRGMDGGAGIAVRMAFERYPQVVFGTLFFGAVVALCVLGMRAPLQISESDRVAPKSAPALAQPSQAMQDLARRLELRALWLAIPDGGLPFAGVVQELQLVLSARPAPTTQYEQWLSEVQGEKALAQPGASRPQSSQPSDVRWLTIGSIARLIAADTLLRFRTVMALNVKVPNSDRANLYVPLLASARFGLRHFGAVTLHVWITRLALLALCVGLIEFPSALTTHFVLPNAARLSGSLPVLPWLAFVQLSTATLIGATVHTFSVAYDARLYEGLSAHASAS